MDGHPEDLVINKRFVTESELEERRKKRQEEWEKVRKPEDPEECPEEVYDPRSLYERLQEQKEKKQQEYEEQFKFTATNSDLKKKDADKKPIPKVADVKNKFSQSKLLAGAVRHRSNSESSSAKKSKLEHDHEKLKGESHSSSIGGSTMTSSGLHCPSASVCIGILPGLGAYSGSSDSESSSDSEATINSVGKIVSSVFRSGTYLDAP
eukprot:XP_012816063.1 PREDICTED: protein FAM192A isoform X1 [Xenopus tropicalis]